MDTVEYNMMSFRYVHELKGGQVNGTLDAFGSSNLNQEAGSGSPDTLAGRNPFME